MTRRFGRRAAAGILASSLAALLIAGCGSAPSDSEAGATTGESLSFKWAVAPGSSGGIIAAVAREKGFLAKHSLEAQTVSLQAAGMISALISGEVDLAPNSTSELIQQRAKDVNIRMVTAYTPTSTYFMVVKADNTTVPAADENGKTWQETIQALRGYTISSAGGQSSGVGTQLGYYFSQAGLRNTDWTAANIGIGAPEIAALQAGSVEAVFSNVTVARSLVETGVGRVVLEVAKQGPELASQSAQLGYMANEDFLTRHPDAADRIQAVVADSIEWITDPANIDELVTIGERTQAVAQGDPDAKDNLTAQIAYLSPKFTNDQIQAAIDYTRALGDLPQGMPMTVPDVAAPSALE